MPRLGIDLGGTKIEAAILEGDGVISLRERIATPAPYDAKIAAIADLVRAIEARRGLGPLNTGLGHPGSHNPRTGLMRNANSTALNGRALDRDVSAALHREVRCANDANCFALSEARDGAGAGAASVFGVILGTGVGGGLVMRGELITGADGNAGEWGHTALPWPSLEEVPGPPVIAGCTDVWRRGVPVRRWPGTMPASPAKPGPLKPSRRPLRGATHRRAPVSTVTKPGWPGRWPASSISSIHRSLCWAAGCRTCPACPGGWNRR